MNGFYIFNFRMKIFLHYFQNLVFFNRLVWGTPTTEEFPDLNFEKHIFPILK